MNGLGTNPSQEVRDGSTASLDPRDPRRVVGTPTLLAAVALVVVVAMIGLALHRLTVDDRARPPRSASPSLDHLAVTPAPRSTDGSVTSVRDRAARRSDSIVHLATGEFAQLPRAITERVGASIAPEYRISPNARRVVFVGANEDGEARLFVARLDGSRLRVLVRGPVSAPSWSPDGSRIVFVRAEETIRVVEIATGRTTRLARGDEVWSPSFSSDGRAIVFTRSTGGGHDIGLWSVPVGGGRTTLIRAGAAFGSFSPDGSTIAFHQTSRHAVEPGRVWPFDFSISLMDADGVGMPRPLGVRSPGGWYMAAYDWDWTRPVWSPDGSRVAYQSFGEPPGEIRVVDVEGRALIELGTGARPSWIDAETLIVEDFEPSTTWLDRGADVERVPRTILGSVDAILDLRTGVATALPEAITSIASPHPDYAVSPDGTELAFVGRISVEERALFIADLDGDSVRQVTKRYRSTSSSFAPAWSPDGTDLTYVADGVRSDVQQIRMLDLERNEDVALVTARGFGDRLWAPVFTPDGTSILYTRRGPETGPQEPLDLAIVPTRGGRPSVFLEDAAFGVFAPDGSALAFRRTKPSGTAEWAVSLSVRVVDPDGSAPRRMVGARGFLTSWFLAWPGERPAWSPNGHRIATLRSGQGIDLVRVETGHARRLRTTTRAVWLDDRRLIVEATP